MHWIDPQSLPETTGTVSSLLFNQHGDADGVVLDRNRQVHLPPHLSASLQRRIRPGDRVAVRGVRPRGAPVIAAVRIAGPRGEVIDEGPHHAGHRPPPGPRKSRPVEIAGKIGCTLYAPRGEVCGALLETGEILRMAPHGNEGFADWLQVGSRIRAWGDAFVVGGRTVVDLGDLAPD
ncbi:hypothetical protein [Xylophilus sp. GOD-11R]|uniref:hypothetical protein n=1 Tax=Xylophilus sp. GOD-11R TaxID=3089814 RepID=UPI00298C7D7D|nr:hypothetical protein [Xylophilus sp. GOD-11R]WPB56684.1 hypothetical protein R9X41_21490 [Xylophilus sp. GOD-11R]